MRVEYGAPDPALAEVHPSREPDGSRVGVNWVDAYLKGLGAKLDDGRKVVWKRRGLELTLRVGDAEGKALLRRLEHGPEVEPILHAALREAAAAIGARFVLDGEARALEL